MPGELEAAKERISVKNHLCHAYNAKHKFETPTIGIPSVLMIGASHITHLKEFAHHHKTERKYNILFDNCFFIRVGGTDWEQCLREFHGPDLEGKKAELGDQWQAFHDSDIKPNFTIIILGSNSLDSFDRKIRALDQHVNHRDGFSPPVKQASTNISSIF